MTELELPHEITAAQAARLLGVGASMLRRYPIPFVRNGPRGRRRYRRDDVIAYRQAIAHTEPVALYPAPPGG